MLSGLAVVPLTAKTCSYCIEGETSALYGSAYPNAESAIPLFYRVFCMEDVELAAGRPAPPGGWQPEPVRMMGIVS